MIGVSGASMLVMVHLNVTITMLAKSGVIPCLRIMMFGVLLASCGVILDLHIYLMIVVVSVGGVGVNVHG